MEQQGSVIVITGRCLRKIPCIHGGLHDLAAVQIDSKTPLSGQSFSLERAG